jgi:hypothetical protein
MRNALIGLIGATVFLCSSAALAQSARDIRGPAGVVPLASEPAAKIVIDPPLADSLVHGRVAWPTQAVSRSSSMAFPPGRRIRS